MSNWSIKDILGWIVLFFFFIWLLTNCTGGGEKSSSDIQYGTVKLDTFMAVDVDTYNRGQDALNTGDLAIFNRYMRSGGVYKLTAGTAVYIHDLSPLKGHAKVTVTSGLYKGETGYVSYSHLNRN